MEKHKSNYEIMKHRMQAEFASHDLNKIANEWQLDSDNRYLYLNFVGREHRIDRSTGAIMYEQGGTFTEADYNASMTLFDILTQKHQIGSGKVCPIGSFSSVHSSNPAGGNLFQKFAKEFDGRDKELASACEKLGGQPYGKGDVGYCFNVFHDLKAALQFWDSDDEFDAELNLFCDANILNFMHFETMMFMVFHILERISELINND